MALVHCFLYHEAFSHNWQLIIFWVRHLCDAKLVLQTSWNVGFGFCVCVYFVYFCLLVLGFGFLLVSLFVLYVCWGGLFRF